MQDPLQPGLLLSTAQVYTQKQVREGVTTPTFSFLIEWRMFCRTDKFEYGVSQDWVYGVKLIYKNLFQEIRLNHLTLSLMWSFAFFREEYLVCDFPCILSTCGGYVGLFFGVSIFDIIFLLEWLIFYHRKSWFRSDQSWKFWFLSHYILLSAMEDHCNKIVTL